MRVLVTGGAGFVGSHVVDALVARGDEVIVLDNLDPAAHGTAAARPDYLHAAGGVEYVFRSLHDEDAVAQVVRGVDAVSHQASKVGLGVDFGDVTAYVRDNDLGTASLLRALHGAGFTGRLVLASSMVVYGEGAYRCAIHGAVDAPPRSGDDLQAGRFEPRCAECGDDLAPDQVDERAPLDPRNTYAATKVHQEHLVSVFARETGASAAMLRYHNVYGPRMPRDTPYAGVASIFRSALASGRAPQVFEDGGQRRDFVHVCDVAAANVAAIDADAIGAFNVASGEVTTVGEMAAVLCDAFGADLQPEVTGAFRLGDVRHIVADGSRARAELGFRPSVGFVDGMQEFAFATLR